MTDREKAIVMAHTGICMLTGDKFQIFHKYVEDIMGRPIMTHEIGWLENTIKKKSKADFIALCAEQEPCDDVVSRRAAIEIARSNIYYGLDKEYEYSRELLEKTMAEINSLPSVTPTRQKAKWIVDDKEYNRIWHCHCSKCKKDPQDYIGGTENWWLVRLPKFCPNCGAEMESDS